MPTLTERANINAQHIAENSERIGRLEECTSEIATVLMGTPRSDLAGGGRKEDGIIHKVGRIEAMLSNGGIKARLGAKEWFALAGALGSGLIAAILGFIH